MEVRNVSLRGRCKESDTLWKSWQAQYFVDVAKTLAGVCHSKDCFLRGRRREFAPWVLYFEVKGLNSWEGSHFWNLSLGMLLRGQCSISYDLGSWFRSRRSTSEAWFRHVNRLRRSCVSRARNAGEIAFLDFEVQPSAEIVRVECAECRWNCVFGFRSATLCGDRACRVRGMQVKLLLWASKCNPLRRSCVSSARNAGEIAISDFEVQPSAEIVRVHRSKCSENCDFWFHTKILHEVLQDPGADILTERSCTRDPHTEILHKRSAFHIQRSCPSGPTGSWCRHHDRDLAQEICRQRSCTKGPTGSWCRHHDREILHKRSADRDPAQEILQDPDADIMTERSWTRDPHTEILHKWSYRILMQRAWQRDLAQEIHIQRSCTRGPTGSWCRHDREILDKRSADRDLAQEALQDPDADIMTERSCTRDPPTEILHKWSYRILMQTLWQRDLAQEIRIQWSCTRGPTGSWCRHPDKEILHKRYSWRDLAQEVLQDPGADIMTERSRTRDPHTVILHKGSHRILMQTSWQRDLGQEIRRQRSCTSGPTGSWCRHHDREILHKRSADRDLAQEALQDPDADIMTERSCTRDPPTEILHKWSYRILMQTSWQRDLDKRSAYSDLAQGVLQDPDADILTKRSCIRDTMQRSAQEVLQDPGADIMTERSCTRDPHTVILKGSHRILMQTSWQRDLDKRGRSCTRGPTGCRCRHHDREILHKRSTDRDLAQEVLQDPDADIMTERSWTRDPHLVQVGYRILMQTSWQRDLAQEIHIQRSCTRGPTGPMQTSWQEHKRSADRDLAQVVLQDPSC